MWGLDIQCTEGFIVNPTECHCSFGRTDNYISGFYLYPVSIYPDFSSIM